MIIRTSLCSLLFSCALPSAVGFATPSPLSPPTRARPRAAGRSAAASGRTPSGPRRRPRGATRLCNIYDDWSLDRLSSSQSEHTYDELVLPLDEESVERCLEEFMDSEYGKTMFGRHDLPASVGITGEIMFDSLEGPEAVLSLSGKFWHRRDTVLGKAAIYLNVRIPELSSVQPSSPDDLADFEDVVDEFTGASIGLEDKRAPDFNGDRGTMEYQGLDPDARGPFVSSFGQGGSMIRPA